MTFYNYTHDPFGQNSGHPVKDYVLNYDYSNTAQYDDSEDPGTLETFRLAEDGFSVQEENCKPPQEMALTFRNYKYFGSLQTCESQDSEINFISPQP